MTDYDDDEFKSTRKLIGNEIVTCILGDMFGMMIMMTDHH
jgi:hypothetical protein